MNILTNYDFSRNQLLNFAIQHLAVAPASPFLAQMYFNTALKRAFIWTGAEWIGMDAKGATMTGASIVAAINASIAKLDDDNLSDAAIAAIANSHNSHSIADVSGLQTALNGKVDDSQVLTNVPVGAVFTDTTYNIFNSTTNGLVPLSGGGTTKFLRADGSFQVPPDTNTTYSVFTTVANGLVPMGGAGTTKYLRQDGTWVVPPDNNTVYSLPIAGATLGGVKTGGDITIDAAGVVSVVDDSHNHIVGNVDGLQALLDAKETPAGAQDKATTALGSSKTYTDNALAALLASAPATLDTLNELASALGNDPNFATTMTNNLAAKANKYSVAIGAATSIVVTHNLNTQNAIVLIRETASPYAQVITDVEFTTVNTITVKFAVAPTAGQYTVTVIG